MSLITLDGRTLDSFGLIVQPGHEHSILPSTVDRTLPLAGRNGAWDFGADMGARVFMFPLAWATETNRENLQQKIRSFASFLTDDKGRPREIVLVFSYEPSVFYKVRYSGSLMPKRDFAMAFFNLPLVAFDPLASGTERIFETTITDSPYFFEIQSNGNVSTEPVIVLTNTGSTLNGFKIVNEYEVI
ncbi:phage tail family protein [Paenibacillus radicis (ex Xue et al. 2023)]|uniref:Phage tail family protein n=1 Tax=Paenibacillus radicis (ex Xue et al. 2023) TaxID=2972489 RepID=A0ABT1YTY4_9BACL|nr:phage tail family protein [Paenibacillus radicis (ex Xue et al. 2023)]MCR8635743.1 phage tail family protein [Paenibacillus radicis (ex Xue et al. 2023)]